MEQGKDRWARDEVRGLLTHASEGALGVDRQQRIVLWNVPMERLTGVRAAKALGRRCHDVLRGRDPAGTPFCRDGCPSILAARKGRPVATRDLVIVSRGGVPLRLRVVTLGGSPAQGDGIAVAHLCRDVTVERRAQQLGRRVLALVGADDGDSNGCQTASELSRRESEVLDLLLSGASTAAIANQLHISRFTARNHVRAILEKLGAHSRAQAVALAFRRGMVESRAR